MNETSKADKRHGRSGERAKHLRDFKKAANKKSRKKAKESLASAR